MPLQPRHDYAAGLHRGLPTGDITQPRSSPPDICSLAAGAQVPNQTSVTGVTSNPSPGAVPRIVRATTLHPLNAPDAGTTCSVPSANVCDTDASHRPSAVPQSHRADVIRRIFPVSDSGEPAGMNAGRSPTCVNAAGVAKLKTICRPEASPLQARPLLARSSVTWARSAAGADPTAGSKAKQSVTMPDGAALCAVGTPVVGLVEVPVVEDPPATTVIGVDDTTVGGPVKVSFEAVVVGGSVGLTTFGGPVPTAPGGR